MEQFSHLQFVQKITGAPRYRGGGSVHPNSQLNKNNRSQHSNTLFSSTSQIRAQRETEFQLREEQGLAELSPEIIPIFLKINPELLNSTKFDLQFLNIEIISEENDGYIVGASLDNLRTLEEKIQAFLTGEHGSAKIADLWEIINGNAWKEKHILSENLYVKWRNGDITDQDTYIVEVSIAFDRPIRKKPDPQKQGGQRRLEIYTLAQIARDNAFLERQDDFERFVSVYGNITSSIIELSDSFACEVSISGKGLKDLVRNYPFVFDVSQTEEISGLVGNETEGIIRELEVLPPEENSPEVGVIDSGIMEEHVLLSAAIKNHNSKSYLTGDISTADHVIRGGHGTKVAGAILFPKGVSAVSSPYRLPCFIRNLRVLDADNHLVKKLPAQLMDDIVNDNDECKVYNLSIASKIPCRTKHISLWAAKIDQLIFEKNILFIVAAGNIHSDSIKYFISNSKHYPGYLNEDYCRIANPSQSCFSLSVGSINYPPFEDEYWMSIGLENEVSPFSRIGFGLWGMVKPDVVEYGGGFIQAKDSTLNIKEHAKTSPELIRSTLHGGSSIGRDSVGTSYSAPKVTHIVAQLQKLYPDETVNLYRALVIQGSRLPGGFFQDPTTNSLRHFGYGLPDLNRVTKNDEYRVTFYNTGEIKAEEAQLFSLKIPEELRSPGAEYEVLIEVTLSYTAQNRRTRQKTKSYLSTWLDWETSKIGEPFETFKNYIIKEIDGISNSYDSRERQQWHHFDWKIKKDTDEGVEEIKLNNSSAQKDWTIIRSYDLPEEICFAVKGHKGWDQNKSPIPFALVVSLEILGKNIPIYEIIRVENEIEIPISL